MSRTLAELLAERFDSSSSIRAFLKRLCIPNLVHYELEGSPAEIWDGSLPKLQASGVLRFVVEAAADLSPSLPIKQAYASYVRLQKTQIGNLNPPGAPDLDELPAGVFEETALRLRPFGSSDARNVRTLPELAQHWWADAKDAPLLILTHFRQDAIICVMSLARHVTSQMDVAEVVEELVFNHSSPNSLKMGEAIDNAKAFLHSVGLSSAIRKIVGLPRWVLHDREIARMMDVSPWCWEACPLFETGAESCEPEADGRSDSRSAHPHAYLLAANSPVVRWMTQEFLSRSGNQSAWTSDKESLLSLAKHLAALELWEPALRLETLYVYRQANASLTRSAEVVAIRRNDADLTNIVSSLPDVTETPRGFSRALLVGSTGHGMSFLLERIAGAWAFPKAYSQGLRPPAWVPIRVDVYKHQIKFAQAFAEQLQRNSAAAAEEGATFALHAHEYLSRMDPAVIGALLSSAIYLLVDLTDELPERASAMIREMQGSYARAGYLVACLPFAEPELSEACVLGGAAFAVHLNDLSEAEYLGLVRQDTVDPVSVGRRVADLFAIEPRSVVPAARNPFLVRCLIDAGFFSRTSLPQSGDGSPLVLHQIVEGYLQVLLRTSRIRLEVKRMLSEGLPHLALTARTQGIFPADQATLDQAIALKLLVRAVSGGEPRFVHQWIGAYFVARALSRLAESSMETTLLQMLRREPLHSLREVLQILVGMLAGSAQDRLFDWIASKGLRLACECLLQVPLARAREIDAYLHITQRLVDSQNGDACADIEERILDLEALSFLDPRFASNAFADLGDLVEISRYPVTNLQFWQFVEDGGYKRCELWEEDWRWVTQQAKPQPSAWSEPAGRKANCPVGGVTLPEARAYCRWLTEKDERHVFRLPDYHEWDHASGVIESGYSALAMLARSTLRRTRSREEKARELFENVRSVFNEANASYRQQIDYWTERAGGGSLAGVPVGVFSANRLGIYDLIGGVWEWCLVSDGEAVLKGGPVRDLGSAVWAAIGGVFDPHVRFERVGFRLCRLLKRATETQGQQTRY